MRSECTNKNLNIAALGCIWKHTPSASITSTSHIFSVIQCTPLWRQKSSWTSMVNWWLQQAMMSIWKVFLLVD